MLLTCGGAPNSCAGNSVGRLPASVANGSGLTATVLASLDSAELDEVTVAAGGFLALT